ncbi:hypothetical protein [Tropicimonas marinistellae]|uniref:hypothetical protein n=1 Tax=Tropicimonas marinistellae TaxID=1739787 RepID=UPI00082B350B|nr:hypothetical protein [Tropicimonas marinistellae]
MAHHGNFDLVCERLRALQSSGSLPANVGRHAEGLLRRLETPVRIAFVGASDGRSGEMINDILGAPVVPVAPGKPPLELRFSETDSTRATRPDGKVEDLSDVPDQFGNDILFLSLARSVPLLKRTCFLDVGVGGSEADMRMALKWVSSRADIFVWCSRDFGDAEQRIWRGVDERLTDHAFLALWGDSRQGRASQIRNGLDRAFLDVIPVDLDADQGAKDLGLARLSDGLGRHAELGRQADSDSALLFLKKYETTFEVPDEVVSLAPSPETDHASVRVPDTVDEPSEDTSSPVRNAEIAALCQEAAALVRERARLLLGDNTSGEGVTGPDVMSHCRETIELLTELLDSQTSVAEGDLAELSDVLMEADELLVLMEIEGEGCPEMDGICLMLQIRRELDTRAAA